ncbi:hypothetical protein FQR65_LT14294 [Abscondita terminalis]|nr:hypothetical protein FQR65_LT14294 [Abscondita terminalis]
MSWSREQVSCLIEAYEKHRCLYAVKSKEYKNKHSRTRALEDIQKLLVVIKPNVNVNDIKAKFHGLKTNFLTEYRKHQKSIRSGAGDDDIYIPTIWYYEKMHFLLEHCVVRASTDTIPQTSGAGSSGSEGILDVDSQQNNMEDDYNTQTDDSPLEMELPASTSSASEVPLITVQHELGNSTPSQSSSQTGNRKKRLNSDRAIEDATDAIKTMSGILKDKRSKSQTTPRNGFDIFGEYVASKLKQMRPEIAEEVEEKIILLLFQGMKKSNNQS